MVAMTTLMSTSYDQTYLKGNMFVLLLIITLISAFWTGRAEKSLSIEGNTY
jgi:hypothetical protein